MADATRRSSLHDPHHAHPHHGLDEMLSRGEEGANSAEMLELGVLGGALLVAAPAWLIYGVFSAGLVGLGLLLTGIFGAGAFLAVRDFRRGGMGAATAALFCAFVGTAFYAGMQLG